MSVQTIIKLSAYACFAVGGLFLWIALHDLPFFPSGKESEFGWPGTIALLLFAGLFAGGGYLILKTEWGRPGHFQGIDHDLAELVAREKGKRLAPQKSPPAPERERPSR